MSKKEALSSLHERFTYKEDKSEAWQVLSSDGPVQGDCEDFALTLIKEITGHFWWPVISGRFKLIRCLYSGDGHMILLDRDTGLFADNIQRVWFDKDSACFRHYTNLDRVNFFTMAFRLFRGLRD